MKTLTWRSPVSIVAALIVAFAPITSYAHSAESGTGFVAGVLHPITGLDHFLAMISVGIVSAQIGGKHIWTVPGIFVTSMILGGLLGVYGLPVPYVEYGIALSVVILGLAIIFVHKHQNWLYIVMGLTCCFGIMHGHAHGVEMPNSASPLYFSFGFVSTTAAIHLLGVLVGYQLMEDQNLNNVLRGLGAAICGTGMVILALI